MAGNALLSRTKTLSVVSRSPREAQSAVSYCRRLYPLRCLRLSRAVLVPRVVVSYRSGEEAEGVRDERGIVKRIPSYLCCYAEPINDRDTGDAWH